MAEPKNKPAETVEVELLQPHRHGGKQHAAGEKVTVTAAQADWLQRRGITINNTNEAA